MTRPVAGSDGGDGGRMLLALAVVTVVTLLVVVVCGDHQPATTTTRSQVTATAATAGYRQMLPASAAHRFRPVRTATTTTLHAVTRRNRLHAPVTAVGKPPAGAWGRLAACESSNQLHQVDVEDGQTVIGLFQIDVGWYQHFGVDPYAATAAEQLRIAEYVLARQGWAAWPVCSRKVGLR